VHRYGGAVTQFDDRFDEIARGLSDIGDRARRDVRRFEAAHGLVADAMRLIRETAPGGLPAPHAWLGAVQIVSEFAHRVAHEAIEAGE
jgi:hypothetical protein